ncbi:N-acetyl glucosamine specific transporter [Candidatus Hepatincolaceae symbiont of Richtersius coronifer]
MGTLGGIVAGIAAGYCYNMFYQIKLPLYLSFFGGRRFVPIVSGFAAIILAFIFGYIWPFINQGIASFSDWILGAGSVGLFTYGVSNRILLPTGLQHITEAIAYFVLGGYQTVDGLMVTGDLNRFFAKDPSAGIFMSGFFPVMIFGLPGAALAIYHSAKVKNKPMILGILLSGALTSILTGVTEPIEFPILFSAPLLFGIHAILMGVSYVVTDLVGYKAGFTFSGGVIDMLLSWGISTKPWMIFIIGPIFFAVYYLIFFTLIKALNLKTPGREENMEEGAKISDMFNDAPISSNPINNNINSNTNNKSTNNSLSKLSNPPSAQTYEIQAKNYLEALGGKTNVIEIDNCISRLRIVLKDASLVNKDDFKKLGAKGIVIMDNNIQIVIGTDVEFLANALKKQYN